MGTEPTSQEVLAYLDQVLERDRLKKSPTLRHLLQYLVTRTVEGHVGEIKESVIAMDVFGRPQEFDGRLDNIVRVQVHRLRKLLDAYFSGEGSHDEYVIRIPRGSYVPQIHRRSLNGNDGIVESVANGLENHVPIAAAPPPSSAVWPRTAIAFFAGVLMSVALIFVLFAGGGHSWAPRNRNAESLHDMPLASLWGPLLKPGAETVVSFTNPVFIKVPYEKINLYMFYRGPLSAPVGARVELPPADTSRLPGPNTGPHQLSFLDVWTGTGETMAVSKLTRMFTESGHSLRVVRSRVLSFSDVRSSNVVFLGSPWANELQDKFNPGRPSLICTSAGSIVDSSSDPGQADTYTEIHDPKTDQFIGSHVLVSVLPGATPETRIISSAGLGTQATYSGIDMLTSASGMNELLRRLDPKSGRTLPEFFQAVIRIDIIQGEPANPRIVVARPVDAKSLRTASAAVPAP